MEKRIRYARTTDGTDIAFAVLGSGPHLLVARPAMSPAVDDDFPGSDSWIPDPGNFRSVVIWDYRGFGLSNAAAPKCSLESSLSDMEAVADALELTSFDLFGHLTLSHTALAFAARYPKRVRRLVLRNPTEPGYSVRNLNMGDIPDVLFRDHFREWIELLALRLIGWQGQRFVERMMAQFTPATLERVLEEMEAMDATPMVASVQTPSLVIMDFNRTLTGSAHGPAGPALTAEDQQFMRRLAAALPNGEITIVKEEERMGPALTNVLNSFLEADTRDENDGPQHLATPSGTAIILFADIVDSTALAEQLGNAAFRERSRTLEERVRERIAAHAGSAVDGRTLGDGVLATFTSASDAIAAAVECAQVGNDIGLALHLGLHAGDVMREGGNVHGQAVSIASRVSDLSAPNEVLVSGTVRDLARASAGVTFEDRGERELKGVGEPVRVYAVRSSTGSARD